MESERKFQMKAAELYNFLNEAIPSSLSCTWDNDGLMCCGEPDKEVKKVLIALDITERVTEKAISEKFDVIISHHPMIFKKIGAVAPSVSSARKAISLIKNDIAAMSFHTRLDALCGGVNDILCSLLEIENAEPFGPEGEEIGRIGYISEPMNIEDFCIKVKNALGAPMILSADCGKPVRRVAVLGGDGKDFVEAAISFGADTYLSGRISYNIMAEAHENGINLIEAGHFYTENPVCVFLSEFVRRADANIETEIFDSNEIKVF